MKEILLVASTLALVAGATHAADPPTWMQQVEPKGSLQPAWQEHQSVFRDAALPKKTKFLVGLGVAAQIPCQYCIIAMTQFAKNAGATDQEIQEAVAAAALTRKWSTMLNGLSYDMRSYRAEILGE